MSEYTPQVNAESAVCELRKAWLEVLANWPMVERDPALIEDLEAVEGGLALKLHKSEAA